MDEGDYDYRVIDRITYRLKRKAWDMYPAASVEDQAKRALAEHIGINIEHVNQTTVLRVQDDVVVHIE